MTSNWAILRSCQSRPSTCAGHSPTARARGCSVWRAASDEPVSSSPSGAPSRSSAPAVGLTAPAGTGGIGMVWGRSYGAGVAWVGAGMVGPSGVVGLMQGGVGVGNVGKDQQQGQ